MGGKLLPEACADMQLPEPGQTEQALGGSKPGQFVEGREDTKREFARLLDINVSVRSDGPEVGVS